MAQGSKKLHMRVCVDCGKVMHVLGVCTMRCAPCNAEHRKNENRRRKRNYKDKALVERRKKVSTEEKLLEDVRRADAMGVSYGKMRMQEQIRAQKGTQNGF